MFCPYSNGKRSQEIRKADLLAPFFVLDIFGLDSPAGERTPLFFVESHDCDPDNASACALDSTSASTV